MQNHVAKYKAEWDELESLVKQARRSVKRLTPGEISRLDQLYRRTAIYLAQVATRTRDVALIRYLNDLTAAAHSMIYLPPRRGAARSTWQFIHEGFGRAVVRTGRYHLASGLLMFFGAMVAYFAVQQDPSAAYALMPEGEIRLPGATRDQLLEILRYGRDAGGGFKFLFASFLFTHNLKVGLLSMATGVLAAIPTLFLMVYNGMVFGAFVAVHHAKGVHTELWAWLLPHGVTELWAVALFGGIGLRLGHAVVAPGMHTRAESLRQAGIEAVRICMGAAAMLVLAAVIESFLRQSHLPTAARFLFAAGTVLFWSAYFARGAIRERRSATAALAEANAG